jgi:hypothetical protein
MVIRPFRREALVAPGEEKGMRLDNCSVEGFAVTHPGTAGKAPPDGCRCHSEAGRVA